jgi:uncharacterized protein YoxC
MSTELSLTIIAICSIILIVFTVIALIGALRLFIVLRKTTLSVEQKIHPLLDETKRIANLTSSTAAQIKSNIELTTPLFQSIGKISSLVNGLHPHFNSDMHDNSMTINFGSKKGKVNIADWAELIASGLVIIQKLRK